jgi:hypothetical protein
VGRAVPLGISGETCCSTMVSEMPCSPGFPSFGTPFLQDREWRFKLSVDVGGRAPGGSRGDVVHFSWMLTFGRLGQGFRPDVPPGRKSSFDPFRHRAPRNCGGTARPVIVHLCNTREARRYRSGTGKHSVRPRRRRHRRGGGEMRSGPQGTMAQPWRDWAYTKRPADRGRQGALFLSNGSTTFSWEEC